MTRTASDQVDHLKCQHPMHSRTGTGSISNDGSGQMNWYCTICGHHWNETRPQNATAQSSDSAPAFPSMQDLLTALEESVKLQSHYARLMNDYDGGARLQFANADAWIARLRVTGTLK